MNGKIVISAILLIAVVFSAPAVTAAVIPPWSIETVDSAYRGRDTLLALDAAGYPHICYACGDVKYAKWTGSTWSIETVDSVGEPCGRH